ncbi:MULTISPECIES: tetratricopeptide repeat protein [Protofrankia]|uniref:Adenylate/guanylate cyclase n=2 Tax=Candidatus Protofrankia datiscae TaxID=2716812 RepID=F8AYK6_9ACTN|nr:MULTISPECIES: tetratricopeptide repeat protein [Protofrankia]AEH11574.1 adenylate/guanylate cyclase [Candidatus Protofrankia datiscae]
MITSPLGGTLRCPRCGTPAVPGGRFCFHCGLPLQTENGMGADEGAERRVVTVLFGDLSDFTAWAEDLDPERVGEVTDRVLAALARDVAEVGGRVDNLTGDGIMAVFGAPTAHEDDPERAVRAAAAMQETVRRLVTDEAGGGRHLGLRVGINTGEVLAGVQASLTYTVIGDTVNTAARLSDAAAVGAVYAGHDTMIATTSVATWRRLAPLKLKGKREPVPTYELVSLRPSNVARPGHGDDAPFTGRDQDLAVLESAFRDVVAHSQPRTVVITGEAGIGKTRIAVELARRAGAQQDARVLWGRTVRHGDGRDLAPLMDIVRTACGVGEGDSPDRVAERVRRTVSRLEHPAARTRIPGGVADKLLALLGVPPEGRSTVAPDIPPGDPAGRENPADDPAVRAVDAIVDDVAVLLGGLSNDGPLVIVLDDLEWATTALWQGLRRFASRLRGPVFLIMLDREVPSLAGLPNAESLALAPLAESASASLLRDYLGGAELDETARAALLARVHGNPFFLTELLNLLVDRGILHRGDLHRGDAAGATAAGAGTDTGTGAAGTEPVPGVTPNGAAPGTDLASEILRHPAGTQQCSWVLEGSLPETTLPAGVQSVLAARIDDLDPIAKAVLRSASVLGSRFPADALPALEDRRGEQVHRALATLTERQLLRAPHPGEPMWTFVHPMARDVAYAGLPKVERARRHAAAAQWGVEFLSGSEAEVAAFVGHHAERAHDLAASMALAPTDPAWSAREPGFHALVRVARSALARDDHRSASDLITSARRLGRGVVSELDDLGAVVLHAEALASLRRLDEAERVLRPALRVATPELRAAAYRILGDLRHKQGRDDEAATALVTALEEAQRAGSDRVIAATLRQLGLLEYAAGRVRHAEKRFTDALALARRVGDPRGVGWALQHLAWSATTRGDYPCAQEYLRDASEVFRRLDDTGGLGWCAGTEALVWLLSGQLSRARRLARDLIEMAGSLGEVWGLAVCLTIDAVAAAELGDIAEAEAEAERAAELFEATGDTWGVALTLVARGLAARGAGDPERGAAHLHNAQAAADQGGHAVVGALSMVLLGLTRLDAGLLNEAEQAADLAMRALDSLELQPHAQLGAKVLAAQVARARGRLQEAIQLLETALAAGEPATLLFPRRQAYAHLAGTLLDAGRPAEALAVARRAVEVGAEDVRAQVLAWRALGTVLVASGKPAEGRAAYEKALAAATATEAVSEAAQTRRLLSAIPDGPKPVNLPGVADVRVTRPATGGLPAPGATPSTVASTAPSAVGSSTASSAGAPTVPSLAEPTTQA